MAQLFDLTEEGASKWMKKGRCKSLDPELFFPSDGAGVLLAKKVCKICSVREICLEYAIVHHIDHGVWGGASERERKRIAKQRRLSEKCNELSTFAVR